MKESYPSDRVWELHSDEARAIRDLIKLAHKNQASLKGLGYDSHDNWYSIDRLYVYFTTPKGE